MRDSGLAFPIGSKSGRLPVTKIVLESVSVDFPIYDITGRSLRSDLLNMRVGGTIHATKKHRVVINALENIDLVLSDGDRVGLVGHNGAGKSTLLRVLAGIYEPVRGRITVNGRVVPVFDLTLGLDMDSTGLENVYLRGLFLGFSRREIERLIKDIAEFSELGDYMYMPLRTYSSGMLVRLAFAVSTCVQPDILLLDEMIGAGDATFIDKVEKRLAQFVGTANIVVVATHSAGTLKRWCNKAVLMHHGRALAVGGVDDILQQYQALTAG